MKKILIIDDSESLRRALTFSLSQKGYKVMAVEYGKEGLQVIEGGEDIGLLITDLQMPEMNGLDVITALRKNVKFQKLPILVLSSDEKNGQESLARGATGFVMKSSKTSEEIHRFVKTYISL